MKPIFTRSIADEHFGRLREILRDALASARPDDRQANLQELQGMARIFGAASLASAAIAATAYLARSAGGWTGDLVQAAGMLADYAAPAAAASWVGVRAWLAVDARRAGLPTRAGEAASEKDMGAAALRTLTRSLALAKTGNEVERLLLRAGNAIAHASQTPVVEVCHLLLEAGRRAGADAALGLANRLPRGAAEDPFLRATLTGLQLRAAEDAAATDGSWVDMDGPGVC